jgi:intein/homing endonuclease
MAKISTAAIRFVRDVFGREKQGSELAIANRSLLQSMQGGAHGVFDMQGLGGINEALGLDRRRMYRYSDYEEMDQYGELNAALDIYADEVTCMDAERKKSVWIESDDEKVKLELEDLFEKRLKIEEKIWPLTRTLCRYGDDFEEIVVGDMGVQDLNYLPPASMHRVENKKSDLVGFVQSYDTDLHVNIEQFEKYKGEAVNQQKNIAVFDDWRVSHMRLLSKHREAMYGFSVLDAARWIWKRLALLEDAVMVYKLCLRGDSQIWTTGGRKAIRDLKEGDEVYSYTEDDELKKTRVIYKKHNGKDLLYRIKSAHRELYANATHPVLVETIVKNGSGIPRGRRMDYVEAQDLIPGIHRLVTPSKGDDLCEEIPLIFPETGQKARLSQKAIDDGVKIEVSIKHLQDTCGMQANLIKLFFRGEYEVVAHTAIRVLKENGTSLEYLDVRDDWGGVKKLLLPDVITPEFARWFGFMIGDGFASAVPFTRNGRAYLVRKVGFAAGDKEDVNQRYKKLFESFFGESRFDRDKRSRHTCVGSYSISSKALYEFMILNGFIPGAHNKRVPEWVFRSSTHIRHEFLEGFADADAAVSAGGVSEIRGRVRHRRNSLELCNRALVEDVRELVMQVGFKVGSVIPRWREGGREILDSGFILPDRMSYVVSWSDDRQPITEPLKSVEEVEVDDIWDIGVEANEHNFVANGIVVHNTRSPSRYAFYIDVGNQPKEQAERSIRDVMHRLKKKKFVNPKTGKLDFKNSPLSLDEDFFLAVHNGKESTRVESLMGPSYQQVDDVEYFRKKLYAAIKIPPAYLGYDDGQPSKATLVQEDTRFAKTVLRIQREVRNGLKKVANVDLAARRIDPAAVDFKIMMAIPSSIFELGQMEVRRARADLASMMERHVSQYWLLSNVYGLSDDEIKNVSKQKKGEAALAGGSGGGGGFESRDYEGRQLSERELMRGKREDEKRLEGTLKRMMEDSNNVLGRQLKETGALVREIAHNSRSKR